MKDESTKFAQTLDKIVKQVKVNVDKKNENFEDRKLGKKRKEGKLTSSQISWSPIKQNNIYYMN